MTSLLTSVSNSKVRNEPNFGSMSQRPRPRSKWCSRNAASDEAEEFRFDGARGFEPCWLVIRRPDRFVWLSSLDWLQQCPPEAVAGQVEAAAVCGREGRGWGRHQRLQQRPFAIRQIACLAKPRPHILAASDFGSGHRELPRIFANPMESQPTEITQLLFRSGSKCGRNVPASAGHPQRATDTTSR